MGCIVGSTLLKAAKAKEAELEVVSELLIRGENRCDELRKQQHELLADILELKGEAYSEMQ